MTTSRDLEHCRKLLRELEEETHAPSDDPGSRRFERFPVRGDVRLRSDLPEASIPPIFGLLRDVSRGGAGVLVNRPVDPNAAFHMELRTRQSVAAVLPAFCRHCRKLDDDAYVIGMAFGAEASLLLAFGIDAAAVRAGDQGEQPPLPGDFIAA